MRPRRSASVKESLLHVLGYESARCGECGHQFLATPGGGVAGAVYASCPKCLRTDLSTWEPAHYHVPLGTRLLLAFGAHRWRCEPCRTNFASFKLRKTPYVRPAAAGIVSSRGEEGLPDGNQSPRDGPG